MEDSSKNFGKKFINGKWYTPEEMMEVALKILESKPNLTEEEIEQLHHDYRSIEGLVQDAGNQFKNFNVSRKETIEEIKKQIEKTDFKNLEKYTGKTIEELNKVKPRICEEYDLFIKELKDPKLTMEKYEDIMKRIHEEKVLGD